MTPVMKVMVVVGAIVAVVIVAMPPIGAIVPIVGPVIAIPVVRVAVVMTMMVDAAQYHSACDARADAPPPSPSVMSLCSIR